jgi:hypothetical protein
MHDFIGVYDNALTPEQCDAIRARFDASPKMERGRTGHGIDVSKKDSFDLTINGHAEWDDVGALLVQTMAKHLAQYMDRYRMLLIGAVSPQVAHPETGEPVTLSLANFDEFGTPNIVGLMQTIYRVGGVNLQKYLQGTGGYHHWHSEIYPQNETCETLHRVLLWQFYLNDVEDGGETEFLYQERKIEARKGRLVIAPAGWTHTHKGHVSRSRDKYIATSWILFQRAEALYGTGG